MLAMILVVLCLLISYAISWGITIGIIKLITLCFGLTFNIFYATGFWLILVLLKGIFSVTIKNKD